VIELLTKCFVSHYHKFQNKKVSAMEIDDIKKLIAFDESRTLELKKTTGKMECTQRVHSLIQKVVG